MFIWIGLFFLCWQGFLLYCIIFTNGRSILLLLSFFPYLFQVILIDEILKFFSRNSSGIVHYFSPSVSFIPLYLVIFTLFPGRTVQVLLIAICLIVISISWTIAMHKVILLVISFILFEFVWEEMLKRKEKKCIECACRLEFHSLETYMWCQYQK